MSVCSYFLFILFILLKLKPNKSKILKKQHRFSDVEPDNSLLFQVQEGLIAFNNFPIWCSMDQHEIYVCHVQPAEKGNFDCYFAFFVFYCLGFKLNAKCNILLQKCVN